MKIYKFYMERLKKKLDSLSIKWKIFLYLIGFCGVLLALLWLLQVVFLSVIYEKIRLKQLYSSASQIESIIKQNGNVDLIENAARDNEACVMIIAANGTQIYSADVAKSCVIHNLPYMDVLDIVVAAKENGGLLEGIYTKKDPFQLQAVITPSQFTDQLDGSRFMIYCKEVKDGGETLGYILINIQLSPVDATVQTIRFVLSLITIIMICFSAILAGIISRRISRPIEKLSRDARQLATGDYETVFDAGGYREINRLSKTLTKTAEELGKVEKLRQDFIANVSHDLRTPLTLIGGYAEVMRDIPGENNRENAQTIIDETKRLSSLVNDVLDMSRIQSGAVPMELKEYNITKSVSDTVSRMNELLKQDGYNIYFDFDREVFVNGDEVRLSQCFYNILINAVNYTGQDKKIYVEQKIEVNNVKISVTDTGEGISKEDMPYVWDRYYKNNKNHKRSVTGTGLGLSIVRSVIKAHGGSCGAYNTRDKGACFWFSVARSK